MVYHAVRIKNKSFDRFYMVQLIQMVILVHLMGYLVNKNDDAANMFLLYPYLNGS